MQRNCPNGPWLKVGGRLLVHLAHEDIPAIVAKAARGGCEMMFVYEGEQLALWIGVN
jgi:hypothetical protein